MNTMRRFPLVVLAVSLILPQTALALDAQKEMKKQGCLKCHAISRKKDGPAIKEIAEKYRDKEDAVAQLKEHFTAAKEIEVDGKKEKHKVFEEKDDGDMQAVIDWILSK